MRFGGGRWVRVGPQGGGCPAPRAIEGVFGALRGSCAPEKATLPGHERTFFGFGFPLFHVPLSSKAHSDDSFPIHASHISRRDERVSGFVFSSAWKLPKSSLMLTFFPCFWGSQSLSPRTFWRVVMFPCPSTTLCLS